MLSRLGCLLYAGSRVVHAAATAELDVLDVPFLDLSDLKGLEQEAESKNTWFAGKVTAVIDIINRVFMPSEEQITPKK